MKVPSETDGRYPPENLGMVNRPCPKQGDKTDYRLTVGKALCKATRIERPFT